MVGEAKTERLENEQLTDSPVVTGGQTPKDVAKENDELVKSKPLLLNQEDVLDKQTDSSARQTDSTPTGQDTLSEVSGNTIQPSGLASVDYKAANPIFQQEPEGLIRADPKPVDTHGTIEPKPESTPRQEIEKHQVKTSPTLLADSEVSGQHVAAESAATDSVETEVVSRPRPLTSEAPTTHVSTKDRDVPAAKSELTTSVKEGSAILPLAPALIDFSTEECQVLGVQVMDILPEIADTTTSMSEEVIQESSRILYPRLDSIMRGT